MIDFFSKEIDETKSQEAPVKSKRPLKMPKNYDFSVRNVDWR